MGEDQLGPQVGAGDGTQGECTTYTSPDAVICKPTTLGHEAPKTTVNFPPGDEPIETPIGNPKSTTTHKETHALVTSMMAFSTIPTRASASSVVEATHAVETTNRVEATDPAATATTAPNSSTVQSSSSGGVSKGAVAGIAIGTAIAGAAIAFLIAFLLFKKRNRKQGGPVAYTKYEESTPELVTYHKNDPAPYVQVASVPPPPARAATTLSSHPHSTHPELEFLAAALPPAADDSTVAQRLSNLFAQIHHHVDHFYRDVHASITSSMESELGRFGMGASIGMVELLNSTSNPTVVIKHALVGYILSITSPDADGDTTFFPKAVVGMGMVHNQADGQELTQALTLYKRLSVYLHLHTTASTSTSPHADMREAAEHFALTFFPWANPNYADQERDEDLVHIIHSALEVAVWLYGQPFACEVLWDGVGRSGIVVSPRVVRVVDDGGHGQVVLENVVVAS